MAAVMSNEVSNTDKISIFVAECERLGIRILPPDINKSGLKFEPDHVNAAGVAAAKVARKTALAQAAGAAADSVELNADIRFEDLPSASRNTARTEIANGQPPTVTERIHLGAIRYGLAAIKNVGESAMESAMSERERGG